MRLKKITHPFYFLQVLAIALTSLCFITAVPASEKIPVRLSHSGDDRVGKMMYQELIHRIKNSEYLKIASNENQGFKMIIMTMPYSERFEDTVSIYEVIWCVDIPYQEEPISIYLTSMLGYCGSMKIKESVQKILKTTERLLATDTARRKNRSWFTF